MNWETVIVAIIGAATTAAVALVPMFVKRRDERKVAVAANLKRDTDSARQASETLIRNLSDRIAELTEALKESEAEKETVEKRLDEERERRRTTEQQAAEWREKNYEMARQKKDDDRTIGRLSEQVIALGGKPQTGPLKPQ
ncbi:MAG TPA: hypothetical protein VI729_05180 [Anaerolineales bacterium]|nr:hypothetical protein [Anaerolineales bacterium]